MTTSDARLVEFYERHYLKVYRYCRRRTTADRVDDAVADTFLTAWRNLDQIPQRGASLPWLYSGAYRVLGHQWRTTSRRKRLDSKLAALGVRPASGRALEYGKKALELAPQGSLVRANALNSVGTVPRGSIRATRDSPLGLTPRQTDVRVLLGEELSNAEIA